MDGLSLGGGQNSKRWTCLCDRKDKFKIPFWTPPKGWFGDSRPVIYLYSLGKISDAADGGVKCFILAD